MDQNLVALYELKRLTFLLGYIQYPERFNDALAFAHFNRVAPVLHENIERETYNADPYADIYAVKAQFVLDVLRYVDERYSDADLKALGFYELEEKFGGYKANRIELIHALKYIRIDGRFDADFWKAIEANAPSEANSIDSAFSPKDVYFN